MILPALLGAAACVGLGFAANDRAHRRADHLKAWDGALLRMENAVVHTAAPLTEALAKGAQEGEPVLKALLERLKTAPAAAPRAFLKDLPWNPLLAREEQKVLQDCLLSLFSASLQEQAQALSYARAQWARLLAQAAEKRERTGKLYLSLGWLGGAAVFILLV